MSSNDAWKKFLLTLPDTAFFGLARHYLGVLTTPFNKHSILEDLEAKLVSAEWSQARRELLSDDDLDALAALLVLGSSTVEETAVYLGWDEGTVRHKVMNLQERFLAFPSPDGAHGRWAVSPLVLDDAAIAPLLAPGRLYPWVPAPVLPQRPVRLHEGTLLALLSFLAETPLERSATGTWKKKSRTAFLTAFDALGEDGKRPRADLLLGVAEALGLVTWENGATVLVWSYLEDYASLSREGRLALLWIAAAYTSSAEVNRSASVFPSLRALLGQNRAFAVSTLVRLTAGLTALGSARQRERLFESWISWGLLIPGPSDGTWVPVAALSGKETVERTYLSANYALQIPTNTDIQATWRGVLACRLIRWDAPIEMELSKASVRRLFSRGVGVKEVQEALEVLAGGALPPNLQFTLQDWYGEHQALRLWKGTVLKVDESRRHWVEHTEHFSQAVLHELAPGVWLVRDDLLESWSKELQQKGLPSLPEPSEAEHTSDWGRPWSFTGWQLEAAVEPPVLPEPAAPGPEHVESDRLKSLLAVLEQKHFPEEEAEEWRARILRRTVLIPGQLDHPLNRGERFEAKGLDFGGKLRLTELAIASHSDLLEIAFRDETGRSARRLVEPQRLEKQGGETLLFAMDLETKKVLQLRVSGLSLVRKIKGSLLT